MPSFPQFRLSASLFLRWLSSKAVEATAKTTLRAATIWRRIFFMRASKNKASGSKTERRISHGAHGKNFLKRNLFGKSLIFTKTLDYPKKLSVLPKAL